MRCAGSAAPTRHGRASRPYIAGVNVRAPEPDDAPAVLELIVARDVADLGRPDYTLDDVKGDWGSPDIDLALDAWLVEDGDGPLGYALLDDSATALIAVPPPSEGQGIGTLLREAAEGRAAARGERRVSQYVVPTNKGTQAHLRDAGYQPAYRYLRMRIDLADAPEPPLEVRVRTFVRGEDDRAVHELIDAAMADIPGNLRSSFESWQAGKMTTESWDPALWLLHEDAGGIAGVALCDRWQDGVGFVDYLMVGARARRRGLGRALLLHGLATLRAAGLTVGELSVQAENASATRLYESVGMRTVWSIERWDKALS